MWFIVVVVILALGALAWWTSGRSRRQLRLDASHEIARAQGTIEGNRWRGPTPRGRI